MARASATEVAEGNGDHLGESPTALTAGVRRRRSSGPRAARQPTKVVATFQLRNSDGTPYDLPNGVKLHLVDVSRDLNSLAERVLNHEDVGLFAKIEVPAPTLKGKLDGE